MITFLWILSNGTTVYYSPNLLILLIYFISITNVSNKRRKKRLLNATFCPNIGLVVGPLQSQNPSSPKVFITKFFSCSLYIYISLYVFKRKKRTLYTVVEPPLNFLMSSRPERIETIIDYVVRLRKVTTIILGSYLSLPLAKEAHIRNM